MKKIFTTVFICIIFLIFLINPSLVVSGASEGLMLWFNSVLPTLFPFFVITSLLINTNSFTFFSRIISPFFQRFFQISSPSVIAVLGGFSCGYPMGAKITNDLYKNHLISSEEGAYLNSFCNNASPMFIISFFVVQQLGIPRLAIPSLIILFISPILCSFLFRKIHLNNTNFDKNATYINTLDVPDYLEVFDNAIVGSMENIIKIGGYIIFFSILVVFSEKFFLAPVLEITNGLAILSRKPLSFFHKYILMMSLTSFGGICAIFQTKCVLKEFHYSIFVYTIEKLITALVTSLLSYFYIQIIFLRY